MNLKPFTNIMKEYQSKVNLIQEECINLELTGVEADRLIQLEQIIPEKLSYHEVIQNPKEI